MEVESKIETAMITRVAARTYISTNSIPVTRWLDRDATKGKSFVSVRVLPLERLQPNSDFYECELQLMAVGYNEHDQEGIALQALYADVLDEIQQDLTPANLTTAINDSKITIDGKVPVQGQQVGDDYNIMSAAARLFLTYTA